MRRILNAALATLGIALTAGAAESPPFELELPVAPVELELHDCRLDLRLELDAVPVVRAAFAPGSEAPDAPFEVESNLGGVRISRPSGDESRAESLVVLELVLDPTQPLSVRGTRLEVTVNGPEGPAQPQTPNAAPEPPAGQLSGHLYELTDSELHAWGSTPEGLTAVNSLLYTENGSGNLVAQLTRSSLTVRGQRGSLQLMSIDSESIIEDLQGNLGFALAGGSLDLDGGKGRVDGTSEAARVAAYDWQGGIALSGTDASVELRGGSAPQAKIDVTNSNVTLDGASGNLVVGLNGGELTADGLSGKTTIAAVGGARVSLRDCDSDLNLTLNDGSSGEVDNASREIVAQVDDSDLDVSGATSLALKAHRSRVSASGLRTVRTLDARRSDVELDLRDAAERTFNISVPDETFLTVYLPSPCRVQLRSEASTAQGLDVVGCELQLDHTGRWRGSGARDLDGRRAFMLNARVAPSGEIRVRGGP